MDSNSETWSPDNGDARPSFRKPSNDAANRKYRRHSPISGSSSSGGSPKNERSPCPAFSREDSANVSDDRQGRKNDKRELERDSIRSLSGKGGGDSRRHSERYYSSTLDHHRHDDYSRRHRQVDEGEKSYKRSSQSYRESRAGDTRRDSDHGRSREYWRNTDKYSRERPDYEGHRVKDKGRESEVLERQKNNHKDLFSDRSTSGRRESHTNVDDIKNSDWDSRNRDRGGDREYTKDRARSLGDTKDRGRFSYEDSAAHGKDFSGRENSGSYLKETQKIDTQDWAEQKYDVAEKRKYDDRESGTHKEREKNKKGYVSPPFHKDVELKDDHFEDGTCHLSGDNDSSAKKLKLAVSDKESGNMQGERLPASSSKPGHESAPKVASEPAQSFTNEAEAAHDLNAAKVAAMKAAELVNRNLVAGGYISADQKKKLLWGNKKNAAAEESGNRWDVSLFSDRERQEKFYKLMGAKGEFKTEQKLDDKDGDSRLRAEKQQELQLDLEKQYTAGLRRRDGRTVGLGL